MPQHEMLDLDIDVSVYETSFLAYPNFLPDSARLVRDFGGVNNILYMRVNTDTIGNNGPESVSFGRTEKGEAVLSISAPDLTKEADRLSRKHGTSLDSEANALVVAGLSLAVSAMNDSTPQDRRERTTAWKTYAHDNNIPLPSFLKKLFASEPLQIGFAPVGIPLGNGLFIYLPASGGRDTTPSQIASAYARLEETAAESYITWSADWNAKRWGALAVKRAAQYSKAIASGNVKPLITVEHRDGR